MRQLTRLLQGDWAGTSFATSGCGPSTCEDCEFITTPFIPAPTKLTHRAVVNNNPASFAEAYWEINSLRIYT